MILQKNFQKNFSGILEKKEFAGLKNKTPNLQNQKCVKNNNIFGMVSGCRMFVRLKGRICEKLEKCVWGCGDHGTDFEKMENGWRWKGNIIYVLR